MRIVHTGDWHLGHTLHEVDRGTEHDVFLAWLLATLEAEAVDALLIAGDIFDSSNPPPAAVQRWHRFLAEAWRRLPRLHVVAIAGNHDAPSRLEASAPLLDALGRLHVVGAATPGRMVAHVPGAVIAAVPFLRPVDLAVGVGLEEAVRAVYTATCAAAREAMAEGDALLAMGHCYMVAGKVSERSERKIQVGNQQALPVDIFPADAAYVALGHLHLAQAVGGAEHVRYAGSPLPLSMDERRYQHAIQLLEIIGGRLVQRRTLPVPRYRPLLRIPEDGALPLAEVLTALQGHPLASPGDDGERWPLVEVCVALERPEPTLKAQLQAAAAGRALRLVRIGVDVRAESTAPDLALGAARPALRGLEDLKPRDVFLRKWGASYAEPAPDVLAAFDALVAMADDPEAAAYERLRRRGVESGGVVVGGAP